METVSTYEVTQADDGFKSYYVVWKPEQVDSKNKLYNMFKSYYVVWKQNRIKINKMVLPSLNRTMQYGNTLANSLVIYFITV